MPGSRGLERLATAAYILGRQDTFYEALEHAHHVHLNGGEPLRAARCAFWIGINFNVQVTDYAVRCGADPV